MSDRDNPQPPKLLRRPVNTDTATITPKWRIAQRPTVEDEPSTSAPSKVQPVKILKPATRSVPVNRSESPIEADKCHVSAEASSSAISSRTKDISKSKCSSMQDAVKLIDDNLDFADFCKEYLLDSNKKYTVIGAIGAQGTGKSTVLSMLAGNEPSDRFRQYVFRPSSREACESCRFQTVNVWVYINKWRTIFLDCQGLGSTSIFEDNMYKRHISSEANDSIQHQLLSLLVSVCHTVLLCIDWFIDISAVRKLMETEVHPLPGKITSERKVNIVVLHQRCKSVDFQPLLVKQRMNILDGMFENSYFDIHGNVNMTSLGFKKFNILNSDVNYVLLSDMRPRPKQETMSTDAHFDTKKWNDVEEYADVIVPLRTKVLELKRTSFVFSFESAGELDWYNMTSQIWRKIKLNNLQVNRDTNVRNDHTPLGHKGLSSRRRRESPKRPSARGTPRKAMSPNLKERTKFGSSDAKRKEKVILKRSVDDVNKANDSVQNAEEFAEKLQELSEDSS
ncbi:protein smg-9 [Ditylenchus destructor]|uniref:Protein smg-9 n=1 Tax=Ditylenchus destructor TaxID=166010 RepID=A0AAD4N7E3_9BILA|nr:protein smg-9 [Ditylenchus destructor]